MQISTNKPTAAQIAAGFAVVAAVTETIRELGSTPAGPLYAQLMTRGVDMPTFEKIVSIVTGAGLVEKRGDLLVWIGPYIAPSGVRS